jgi:Fungal specific transcription factor domain
VKAKHPQRPILPAQLSSDPISIRSRIRRKALIAILPWNPPADTVLPSCSEEHSSRNTTPDELETESHALTKSLSTTTFKSQLDYQCYQFFVTNVAQGLSAFSPSDLWHRSILQVAEAEPFILDAVVAIGAIHKIINEVPEKRSYEAVRRRFNHEHQFAIQKYQNSLASMRNAIASGTMAPRTALIACLLTVCFENAYGRKDLALNNCIIGAKLAKSISIPILDNPARKAVGFATFMSCTIEDELVAVFSRLDIYGMVLIDPRPGEIHRTSKDKLDDIVENMPPTFDTIKEASTYGNVVMTRCWYFIKIMQGLEKPPPWLPQNDSDQQKWANIEIRYGWNPWTGTEEEIPERWLNEAEACVAELKCWFSAFNTLWLKLHRVEEMFSQGNLQATLLRLQALSTMVSVQGCIYRRETEWDIHLPEFEEIVVLCEIYLTSKPKQPYMAFEHETLVYLYYLILKCRDGTVRRKALQLMDEYPRREAFLNSIHAATVGQWVLDIEEEGLQGVPESSAISEERRMRVFGLDFDHADGRLRTHGSLTMNGEMEFRSIIWP